MKHALPKIPENPQWVAVSVGSPRKEVARVKLRLSYGAVIIGSYNNREKKWLSEDGKVLTNVTAWKLLQDSLETAIQE